jgi:hypothetical protein
LTQIVELGGCLHRVALREWIGERLPPAASMLAISRAFACIYKIDRRSALALKSPPLGQPARHLRGGAIGFDK